MRSRWFELEQEIIGAVRRWLDETRDDWLLAVGVDTGSLTAAATLSQDVSRAPAAPLSPIRRRTTAHRIPARFVNIIPPTGFLSVAPFRPERPGCLARSFPVYPNLKRGLQTTLSPWRQIPADSPA